MIRLLAWCGTNQSRSPAVMPACGERRFDDVGDHADGVLEHLAAFHAQMPTVPVVEGPPST